MNSVLNNYKVESDEVLPIDWSRVSIQDIAEKPQYGYTESATDEDTGVKFLRITDITEQGVLWSTVPYVNCPPDKRGKYLLQRNDILFARTGATTGKSFIVKDCPEAIFASYLIRLRVYDTVVPDFLYFFFQTNSYWQQISQTKTGAAQPGINGSKLQELQIALPPLPEQRRIAAVLNAIQEAIAAQEDVIAAARAFKRSLMARLFTYGPGRTPAVTKETAIGEIPAHWEVVRLGDVLSETQYGLNSRAELSGTYPVLRMNNLSGGKVDISDLKYVELDERELEKYQLRKRDLLFNRTNSFELVGKTSIFDRDETYTFASYLVRVVPEYERLQPEYLNHYLNWEMTQQRLKLLATRGVSQSNISPTKLRTLPMAFPELNEQERISDYISAIDEKIAAEEDRKAALQSFFQSMLHQLMTGQVRLVGGAVAFPEGAAGGLLG